MNACGCKRAPAGHVECELEVLHDGAHVGHSGGKKYVWTHTLGVRAIRISSVTDLPRAECTSAIALAMEELAIAQALAMVHGRDRAAAIYEERGGHVRFYKGEPVLLWSPEIPSPFAAAS